MRILTAISISSVLLLGLALSSSVFANGAKLLQQQEEVKSFTIASGGGGVRGGRGHFDRARGFDRARSRQHDDNNPSSGFGRSDEGLTSPDNDEYRTDNPDPQNVNRYFD